MKKNYSRLESIKYSLIIFIILNSFLYGQWTNVNSGPELRINDSHFIDINNGFIVDRKGLYKTTNGGDTWEKHTLNTEAELSSIFFPSPNIGYITADRGIFKTTDSGNNWQQINDEFFGNGNSIFFTDSLTGYLVRSGMLKSTDGGLSWDSLTVEGQETINSVFFINSNIGYAVGTWGKICKTTNAGESWQVKQSGTDESLFAIHFADENTGYIVGEDETVLKTTDGGNNWQIINHGDFYQYTSVFFVNSDTGFIAAGNSIMKTTDGGLSWQGYIGVNSVSSVYFLNSIIGYAVGGNGTIIKTTNAGDTWISKSINKTYDLYSISFGDSNTGFAVGNMGTILRTTNKGETWENISIEANYTLKNVQFINSEVGFINGSLTGWDQYFLFKTTNSGNTWSKLEYVQYIDGYLFHIQQPLSISFMNPDLGFVMSSGSICKTTDGGNSWVCYNDFQMITILTSLFFLDSTTGYSFGLGLENPPAAETIFLKTTDCGLTWSLQNLGIPNVLTSVFFVNPEVGYAAGYEGLIFKTINGGETWDISRSGRINTGSLPYFSSICFTDENNGYASAEWGLILKTTNGGEGWGISNIYGVANNYNPADLYSICFVDSSIGLAVGESGIILRTTNAGGVTSVKSDKTEMANRFNLNQNYPNPFNPSTSIQYAISSPANGTGTQLVTLKVYDLLGREVATLVNEEKPAGSYEVEFIASNLASGIYFYKLQSGDYSEIKKMILMK
jgi:photosystem II stability/assembly factor-like uncharacterized protein